MAANVESLPIYIIIGVVAVIGVSQIHRTAGAILGVLMWAAVAYVGNQVYDEGHALGILSLKLARPAFLALCGVLALSHVLGAVQAHRRKGRRGEPSQLDDAE